MLIVALATPVKVVDLISLPLKTNVSPWVTGNPDRLSRLNEVLVAALAALNPRLLDSRITLKAIAV
jgi:hypothetical protein